MPFSQPQKIMGEREQDPRCLRGKNKEGTQEFKTLEIIISQKTWHLNKCG